MKAKENRKTCLQTQYFKAVFKKSEISAATLFLYAIVIFNEHNTACILIYHTYLFDHEKYRYAYSSELILQNEYTILTKYLHGIGGD